MKIRHSITALLAVLFACGLQAQDSKPADKTPKMASGLLMKQGDKLVFAPCRDRSYAMVDDISPERMVTQALDSVGLAAGKKLYVELMAVLDGGMLRASGLNLARTEGRCQQPGGNEESWRASGNEPGWLLAVGPEVVVLKRLGQPDANVPPRRSFARAASSASRPRPRLRGSRRVSRTRSATIRWPMRFSGGRRRSRSTARRSRAAPGSADRPASGNAPLQ